MECAEIEDNENANPITMSIPEVSESVPEKVPDKKPRRRSSAGFEILASCISDDSMDQLRINTNLQRPRRVAAIKAEKDIKKTNKSGNAILFDYGEKVSLKSCMKSSRGTSLTQAAAKKVLKRCHSQATVTPCRKIGNSLRFNSICTIRVITPRAQYDPNNLCLPSDDEDTNNPERERLSTVNLDITPQSQAYLESIRNKDGEKVQFRAQMVFGDGITRSESVSTCTDGAESSSSCSSATKSQRKRKKSLIFGSASPLITREKEEETEDMKTSEPERKRDRRRSTRILQPTISEDLSTSKEEVKVKQKRIRRKSVLIKKSDLNKRDSPVSSSSTFNDPTTTTNDFFSPRTKKEEKVMEKDENDIVVVEEVTEKKRVRRKSSRFDAKTGEDNLKINEEHIEKIEPTKTEILPSMSTPPPKKFFSMFTPKSSKTVQADDEEKKVTLTPVEKSSEVSIVEERPNVFKQIRIRKRWGDRISSTYAFVSDRKTEKEELDNVISIKERALVDENNSSNEEKPFFELKTNENGDDLCPSISQPQGNETENAKTDKFGLEKEGELLKELGPNEYKPKNVEQLMEDGTQVDQIRVWLKNWKKRVRKEAKKQDKMQKNKQKKGMTNKVKRKKCSSSSEDDDDYGEDDDYEEEYGPEMENPMIIIGPTGVGKTAMIETIAKELNMKIVGMGPDEERRGTTIKSKLTEAMRSHRINNDTPNGFVRLFQNKPCFYQKKEQKSSSSEGKKTNILDKEFTQSLIVIEHVDLFFGQFDKFATTALIEMVNAAKVPVIWTCEKEYPNKTTTGLELETKPIEIHLRRNKSKVRKYCQQLIYYATKVWIDDSNMEQLVLSCQNDLRATIRQAYFFALKPSIMLPLPSRSTASNGFKYDWSNDKDELKVLEDRVAILQWEKQEGRIEKCRELQKYIEVSERRCFPEIEDIEKESLDKLQKKQNEHMKNMNTGFESLYGRHSKNSIKSDLVPYLDVINKIEQTKMKERRRRLHRFSEAVSSEYPIDDHLLLKCLAKSRSQF